VNANNISSASAREPVLIPKPVKIVRLSGRFLLLPTTCIQASKEVFELGKYLKKLLQSTTEYSLALETISGNDNKSNSIILTTITNGEVFDNEGYRLKVTKENIIIIADQATGIFYGIQTLRQLLPSEIECFNSINGRSWYVQCILIEDKPKFKWRGMMLDTSRHMFSLESIKRFIDLLALHKLNIFHWHLTDDQGWRIEIEKYPKLTHIGAFRDATPIPRETAKLDSKPYGGYYSRSQIKEVVSYASRRFITVIPEIDMPGHSLAALAGYPEYGCTGGPYKVSTRWGIEKDVFCVGNDNLYAFLENVLTEVLDLFPGRVIHIGGDEVEMDRWKFCPKCQNLKKKQKLKNEYELQNYFFNRIINFLHSRDRQTIGWDEILDGELPQDTIIMSWRGEESGIKAAGIGHEVVMCPVDYCYFDYRQATNKEDEPPAQGEKVLPLEKVYSFDPIPDALSRFAAKNIIGAQGNVWTEYITTYEHVEYMVFPRMTALSEVLWAYPKPRDFQNFNLRLRIFLKRLQQMGINYHNTFFK